MDINAKNLEYLFTGYSRVFQRGHASRQDADEFLRFTRKVPSTGAEQKYPWLGQFPKLREWVGERIIKQLSAHEYTIKNRKFESTVQVDRETIEDDQFGLHDVVIEDMGAAAREWPGDLVYELIRQGDTLPCYDGEPFFSASHPVEYGAGVKSNWGGGSGELWLLVDGSRPMQPFIFQERVKPEFQWLNRADEADSVFFQDVFTYGIRARGAAGFGLWQLCFGSKQTLDKANFDAAMVNMMSLKNDEGSDLKIRPTLLVTTPANRTRALEVVKAARLASGATNTNFGAVEVLITNQLAA